MPNRDFYRERMRSYRSGRLGEVFCEEVFGIKEPRYEIKSNGHRRAMVVAQACQLLESMEKQYVIIRYHRDSRTVTRGTRKGRPEFTDTIEEAYKKKVDVYVVQGHVLISLVVEHKMPLWCTAKNKNLFHYGKWGLVYRIPLALLPVEKQEETDRYTLWYDSMYPPGWLGKPIKGAGFLDFDGDMREPGEDKSGEKENVESGVFPPSDDTPF